MNLKAQPHWTVFLTDFQLPIRQIDRIRRHLIASDTRPLFIRIDHGAARTLGDLRSAGVDIQRDYVSIQAVLSRDENRIPLQEVMRRIVRCDMATVEVPSRESGFRPAFASHLLNVVMRSDYFEQDRIADRFFELLGAQRPYEVKVATRTATLIVRDDKRWFQFAGPLRANTVRLLPDGEVAYFGEHIEGKFVIDGAILPIAQHPRFAEKARRVLRLSRAMEKHPLGLEIRHGNIVAVTGNRDGRSVLEDLFKESDRYRRVVEVGISFNRACRTFIHSWPAASNEGRPGVHLGLGGPSNPDDGEPERSPLIHIDCMAANCAVFVNGKPFLRASR
ncbi:MAG: hypothetical protein M3041_21220 [Acidobacteriota bacterium]|nr:hypothetical protein [Acidobacteriota bacterium]